TAPPPPVRTPCPAAPGTLPAGTSRGAAWRSARAAAAAPRAGPYVLPPAQTAPTPARPPPSLLRATPGRAAGRTPARSGRTGAPSPAPPDTRSVGTLPPS